MGRQVQVFVEGLSRKGARSAGRVQLGWETRKELYQVSGRTAGDLIAVFEVPSERAARSLAGRIVTVRVTGAGPLILSGELVEAERAAAQAG